MHHSLPKVVVLILSYNGKRLLKEAISSYLANEYPNFEMAVVDNASSDGTKEYLERHWPKVHVVRTERNLGYAGGANLGLKYAFEERKADYALFTNNDVRADHNIIEALVKTASSDEKIAFTVGKVYYYDQPNVLHSVGKRYDKIRWNGGHIGRNEVDKGQYDQETERAWCDDIYWLINKAVYFDIGGYDTEFFLQGEDFDYQVRAKKAGYKIYYTPEAKLWHMTSETIGRGSSYVEYFNSRNPLIVHMKHRPREESIPCIRQKRNELLALTPKLMIRLRFRFIYRMWLGYHSALHWGRKNNRL